MARDLCANEKFEVVGFILRHVPAHFFNTGAGNYFMGEIYIHIRTVLLDLVSDP